VIITVAIEIVLDVPVVVILLPVAAIGAIALRRLRPATRRAATATRAPSRLCAAARSARTSAAARPIAVADARPAATRLRR
jgi:hypothetical protein